MHEIGLQQAWQADRSCGVDYWFTRSFNCPSGLCQGQVVWLIIKPANTESSGYSKGSVPSSLNRSEGAVEIVSVTLNGTALFERIARKEWTDQVENLSMATPVFVTGLDESVADRCLVVKVPIQHLLQPNNQLILGLTMPLRDAQLGQELPNFTDKRRISLQPWVDVRLAIE